MKLRASLAVAVSMLLASSAIAANAPVAQLQASNGKVLVNQGKGFVPASGLISLNAGDKIMVGKDSSASVLYTTANCSVDVAASTVVAVQAKAPCSAGQTIGAVDSVFVHSAAGSGGNYGGAPYVPYVVTLSLITTGALMAVAITQDENGAVSRP